MKLLHLFCPMMVPFTTPSSDAARRAVSCGPWAGYGFAGNGQDCLRRIEITFIQEELRLR
jgi:hypothetical protein